MDGWVDGWMDGWMWLYVKKKIKVDKEEEDLICMQRAAGVV